MFVICVAYASTTALLFKLILTIEAYASNQKNHVALQYIVSRF
jgi:hypothetical protein